MIYDVAVIGMGPAGLTCSLQLKRYGINTISFESNEIGGLLRNAYLIENYPGFPNGISGIKLCSLMRTQVINIGIKPKYERVEAIEYENDCYLIVTNSDTYKSRYCVIATGTKPIHIKGVDIEKGAGKDVFYEIQDMPNTINESIIIIGSGDAAFDYSLNLANNNDVEIYCRNENIKSLQLLYNRALSHDRINIIKSIELKKINRYNNRLLLTCEHHEKIVEKTCDKVLIAIGRSPNSLSMTGNLKQKYLKLKGHTLFEIGDLANGIYRQATISCGEGMKTAMRINELLRK